MDKSNQQVSVIETQFNGFELNIIKTSDGILFSCIELEKILERKRISAQTLKFSDDERKTIQRSGPKSYLTIKGLSKFINNAVNKTNVQSTFLEFATKINAEVIKKSCEENKMDLSRVFQNKKITILGSNDKPLFNLKEICEILDITDVKQAKSRLLPIEKTKINIATEYGENLTTVLTEQGLYSLIFRSNKPIAQEFRCWVCDIIIQLRLKGHYEVKHSFDKELEQSKKRIEEADEKLKELMTDKEKLAIENIEMSKKIIDVTEEAEKAKKLLQKVTHEKKDILYIMKDPLEKGEIFKIGKTCDYIKRQRSYQTSRVDTVSFINKYECVNCKIMEDVVKYILQPVQYIKNNELYNLSVFDIDLIMKYATSIDKLRDLVEEKCKDEKPHPDLAYDIILHDQELLKTYLEQEQKQELRKQLIRKPETIEKQKEMILKIKEYVTKNNELPKEGDLADFIRNRKKEKIKGRVNDVLKSELESIPGWSWNIYEDKFEEHLKCINEYVIKNNRFPRYDSKCTDVAERRLGDLLRYYVRMYQLTPEKMEDRMDKLKEIATTHNIYFEPSGVQKTQWEYGIKLLKDYVAEHKEAPPSTDKKIGSWLQERKKEKRKGILDADKNLQIVEILGNDWSIPNDEKCFKKKCEELSEFIEKNNRWPTKNENRFIIDCRTKYHNRKKDTAEIAKLKDWQKEILDKILGPNWTDPSRSSTTDAD